MYNLSPKRSWLSRATQKMKAMDGTLLKASRIYPDCLAMVNTLRSMTYNAEEQLRSQRDQTAFLVQLAARTTQKGFHCLSMRLTTEYFALQPEEQKLPNQDKLQDPDLYHFAVFSDNVLACSVVVNSTVSTSKVCFSVLFLILDSPFFLKSGFLRVLYVLNAKSSQICLNLKVNVYVLGSLQRKSSFI